MLIKRGPRAIKEFSSALFNQFGMRVVVLAAYINEDGHPATAM